MGAADLARDVALLAQHLDELGYPYTGTLRQAARQLLEVPEADDDGCRGCGAELAYAGRGRPRVWCSERCRRRARP